MKITRSVMANFEHDQENYGLKVALHNLLWLNAVEQLKDIGVGNVKTTPQKKTKVKKG